jgi:hypothetical protein
MARRLLKILSSNTNHQTSVPKKEKKETQNRRNGNLERNQSAHFMVPFIRDSVNENREENEK